MLLLLYVFLSSWSRTHAIHFEFRQFCRFTGNLAGVAVGRDIGVLYWISMWYGWISPRYHICVICIDFWFFSGFREMRAVTLIYAFTRISCFWEIGVLTPDFRGFHYDLYDGWKYNLFSFFIIFGDLEVANSDLASFRFWRLVSFYLIRTSSPHWWPSLLTQVGPMGWYI